VTVHLRPTAAIAPDALLPGDPGRALALAQDLLESPRMTNHHRGLWGYAGATASGRALTIQSTGVGGPSAAIVLHELVELGVKRAVRVGTCAAAGDSTELGSLLVATEAVAGDGTSRALDAPAIATASPAVSAALVAATPEANVGRVATTDLFYGGAPASDGALALEMESAPLFALGRCLDVEVGCLLAVVAGPGGEPRISEEELRDVELRMGRAAARALTTLAEGGRRQLAAEPSSTSSRD
jgi:uridine phosphorylase